VRRWVFWTVATVLLATVVHLSVVLFAPMVDIGRRMAAFETAAPVNTLRKMPPVGLGPSILVEPSPDISYGFCRFDISALPLKVSAPIPDSYWSVSVFSDTGENLYTINDAQTGVRRLELIIADRSNPVPEGGAILDVPEDSILYPSPVRYGLVVLRGFIPDRSQRRIIDSTIASATCAPLAPA
jgi:uncharacterized membrane protein